MSTLVVDGPRPARSRGRAMSLQFLSLYVAIAIPVAIVMVCSIVVYEQVMATSAFRDQIRDGMDKRYRFVRTELDRSPVERWPDITESARRLYPSGLSLHTEPELMPRIAPVPDEAARYAQGRVAFAELPNGVTLAYQRLVGTPYVVASELSFSNSTSIETYLWFLLIAALSAAPVLWFWFRPFWNDMQRLAVVTDDIGAGEFAVRASPVRSSALRPFADAIDRMSGRIRELLDAQRRLTNSVAHELTTPITQLIFALELVKDSDDPARVEALLDGMDADLRELDSLVAELLEYARLDHAAVFEPETVVLGELLSQSIDAAAHGASGDKALSLAAPAADALVCCDVHQMQRAIVNLLRNALRYGRRQVSLSTERVGERTRIHVDDDGPGIPEGTEATLFEPFARLDSSRTRETGGHGLGLAIVQQVAKLHGGQARIARSPLGGARVTIEW